VRLGADTCALVRHTAKERGCTIADLLRPAILASVNAPSTTLPPSVPQAKMPGKQMAPRIADRPSDSLDLFLPHRLNKPARKATVQHPGAALLRDRISRKSTCPGAGGLGATALSGRIFWDYDDASNRRLGGRGGDTSAIARSTSSASGEGAIMSAALPICGYSPSVAKWLQSPARTSLRGEYHRSCEAAYS
jgi:hypothetical protein